MSTQAEKTNEALLISLMSTLAGDSSTNEKVGEENTLNFRYTVKKDTGVEDSHIIDGDYFTLYSKNQITIDTEFADGGERSDCKNHTLVDGVCIKCLDNTVSEHEERIKNLELYNACNEPFKIDADSSSVLDIKLPQNVYNYMYIKPTDTSLVKYYIEYNSNIMYKDSINELKIIIDGSDLTNNKDITFAIGENKWEITFNIVKKTNYVYNLIWIGPMTNFLLEKITHS